MRVELIYEIVTSVEFWLSFINGNLINDLKKQKTMNILKSVIVGVGAIMWRLKTNMTREFCKNNFAFQDDSKGFRIPLSTLL
jgi:hypothetical protein